MPRKPKLITSLLLLSITLMLSGCIGQFFSPSPNAKDAHAQGRISPQEFSQRVTQASGTVVVDFYAEWCGPCKALSPILEDFAKGRPDMHIVKVNVDANPELVQTYKVSSIPHLFIFRGGQVVSDAVGLQDQNALAQLIGPPAAMNGVTAIK